MPTADRAQYERMTQTPIPKLITKLSIPTVASMLVTALYNTADTFFVSHLGKSATAAVGVTFALMAIIQAMGFMFGMGSGSLVSRLMGEQKNDEAEMIASSGIVIAVLAGLCLTIGGSFFIDPLLHLLGSTDSILPYARSYASYILYAAPVMSASFVLNNILRAEGHATMAMVGITAGGILNMVLDPILIFWFDMGIAGAAIATMASQTTSCLVLLSFFLRKKSILRPSLRKASLYPLTYWEISRTGLSSFFRQGLAATATATLNATAGIYGDAAIAAMSVVGRIFLFINAFIVGLGQGYQPVAGFNFGAGKFTRVRESFWFVFKLSLLVTGSMAVMCAIGAYQVMSLFGDDPEMLRIGTFALRAQCISLLLQPCSVVANMTFQAVGQTWRAAFLACCRQGIYFFPLINLLPRMWGLVGVQLTQSTSDMLTCLTCIPFLYLFLRKLPATDLPEANE